MKKSISKRTLHSAVAVALGLLLAVALAEGVVRLFGLAPGVYRISQGIHRLSPNPDLRYELVPYSTEWGEAINADGRRDFHYPMKKDADTFRIAVLGDSVTFGWACRVWDTHPKALEYYLNQFQKTKTTHFEAWNFGVRGYGISEEVACLKSKALKTNPDLLILAYYLNDPDPFSVDLTGLLSLRQWSDEQYMHDMRNAWGNRIGRLLFTRSRLFTFVKYRAYAKMQKSETRVSENREGAALVTHRAETSYEKLKSEYFFRITEQYWERVAKGLAEFSGIAKERQIPCVLMIFPCLDDLENYKYQPIHDRVASEARKNGFVVIDMKPNLQRAEKIWPGFDVKADFNHPNWRGQRVAGLTVATRLIEEGLLPQSKDNFNPDLFNFSTARPDIDKTIYADQDMFQVEWGLARIKDGRSKEALAAFERAYQLNPDNRLMAIGLKELLKECDKRDIRAQALALMQRIELRL
jgi:hypothetical protein